MFLSTEPLQRPELFLKQKDFLDFKFFYEFPRCTVIPNFVHPKTVKKDFLKKFYIFCFVKKLYLNFDVKKHVELKKCTSKVINFSTVIARCRFNVLQKMRGLYLIGVKRI